MNQNFSRNEKYKHEEKLALGEIAEKYKDEYDAGVKRNKEKTRYDCKRKKHVPIKPDTGYVPTFVRAAKLASRLYDLVNLRDPS